MNPRLLFKAVFFLLLLLLLVLMGMSNREFIAFKLPPLLPTIRQPSALMFFAFFGVGFIAGAVLMAGGGKKGGKSD